MSEGLRTMRRDIESGKRNRARKYCSNCKCDRYNPCNCMKKDETKKDKKNV